MSGIIELNALLKSLSPELCPENYVFCTLDASLQDFQQFDPLAIFREQEGVTLIVNKSTAEKHRLKFCGVFRQLTLNVHSSLNAVGLTAAVAAKLTERGISANFLSAFYHDHIFVPFEDADEALVALIELSRLANSPS